MPYVRTDDHQRDTVHSDKMMRRQGNQRERNSVIRALSPSNFFFFIFCRRRLSAITRDSRCCCCCSCSLFLVSVSSSVFHFSFLSSLSLRLDVVGHICTRVAYDSE